MGADADVTIIDPEARWKVDAGNLHSLSSNTSLDGWKLQGRAETVIVGGRIKFQLER